MDRLYWIWISASVRAGNETFGKLIQRFGTAEAIYSATDDELAAVIGSRSRDYRALCDKSLDKAREILDFCERKSVGILTYADAEYPEALRSISSPPAVLYYRGKLPDFNSGMYISMVGTRRLTDYGRRNAFRIGHDLAKAGAVIVSGMAIGIDGVSHAGSISAGGVNVAFLGSGIDVCYPPVHLKLAREIVKSGCILTEYPPHSRPEGYHFPKRNRLIAALARAIVVIEGTERSGSLITAKFAKEYGKNVYALPGNVDNKTSEATNLLIKNGARLITNADDVIADLETSSPGMLNQHKLSQRASVDMNKVLSELEIACVSASDGIFETFRSRREKKRADKALRESGSAESSESEKPLLDERKLDDVSRHVYGRIPVDTDIAVDELADDTVDMKGVMRALLKLEMGRFIVMLPGERVKRNI